LAIEIAEVDASIDTTDYSSIDTPKNQSIDITLIPRLSQDPSIDTTKDLATDTPKERVTKRCRLPWLTNSSLVYEPKCGGAGGELRGLSQ